MNSVTFYRQEREDAGVRTGIGINELVQLENYQSAGEDYDPALKWFVEIQFQGVSIPGDPEEVRRWLIQQAPTIREGLIVAAEKFRNGVDVHQPSKLPLEGFPQGVSVQLLISAQARNAGHGMGQYLADLANHWEEWIQGLKAPEPISW